MTASVSFLPKYLSLMISAGRICRPACVSHQRLRLAHSQPCEEHVAIKEPYVILQHWLEFAQTHVPQCSPHLACMATVDKAGQPVTRLTTIEEVNAAGITFFTSLGSRQAGEICSNPHMSLHFNWPVLRRSVRIAGSARQLTSEQVFSQFRRYPRHVQLSISTGSHSRNHDSMPKHWHKKLYARFREYLGSVFGGSPEEIPMPANWGGFLLKPSLYEFGVATGTGETMERMRFRRCLALPRGKRNQTINADRYDWVYDNYIENK
ncbi:uncharacterized protein Dwil_GK12025 [Drosophila willistoni]|uniref:pyridoxal 5'-phosphate synthase n=1 Tax=Drosophila willistoni TaxID=7260 RepID=B4N8C3_DROWI|nr:pyridoxine/pyridoxamine 5'-phosphate oxidase [Drosophila willistoni]EDW81374.1 uncharacterized protein Dwil_GK12025 [Drosophila willistoni]